MPPRTSITEIPTAAEERRWAEEADAFIYKPAIPGASPGSVDSKTWGIPPDRLAPPSAIQYVLGNFRENVQKLVVHDKNHREYIDLHPMYKWSIIAAVHAHFLWFRTPHGAEWLMSFYGVEEVQPFREGYAYFWADPRSGALNALDRPTYQTDPRTRKDTLVAGVELRIFRPWESDRSPPCSPSNTRPVEEMKKLLGEFRNPYESQAIALPDEKVFLWVAESLRDWFAESKPNHEWPTPNPRRIVGWQWVQMLERSPGVPFFEGLAKVTAFKGRAYRIKASNGGIYWCSGKEIRAIPLKDLFREQGRMAEADVQATFMCEACHKVKACTPATGTNHRCCHCYGIEVERNDRPTLSRCTMDRECKACPDVIGSKTELIALTNRLNRPASTGPVPR